MSERSCCAFLRILKRRRAPFAGILRVGAVPLCVFVVRVGALPLCVFACFEASPRTLCAPAVRFRAFWKPRKLRAWRRRATFVLHEGATGVRKNRTAGALRHARSLQRARQATQEYAKTRSGSAPTRAIPAEGARLSSKMRENAHRSDARDFCRGCAVQWKVDLL